MKMGKRFSIGTNNDFPIHFLDVRVGKYSLYTFGQVLRIPKQVNNNSSVLFLHVTIIQNQETNSYKDQGHWYIHYIAIYGFYEK